MSFSLGIVGHAADKFTPRTRQLAHEAIIEAIADYGATCVVSGGCHLGGVDIYAEDIALAAGIPTLIHRPQIRQWKSRGGLIGYEQRNLYIARDSDLVLCVVVRDYPVGYRGMRFDGCYHCDRRGREHDRHVKSGGCYTAWKCKRRAWRIIV